MFISQYFIDYGFIFSFRGFWWSYLFFASFFVIYKQKIFFNEIKVKYKKNRNCKNTILETKYADIFEKKFFVPFSFFEILKKKIDGSLHIEDLFIYHILFKRISKRNVQENYLEYLLENGFLFWNSKVLKKKDVKLIYKISKIQKIECRLCSYRNHFLGW